MDVFHFQNPDFRRFSEALERLYAPTELGAFPQLVFEVIGMLVRHPLMSMEDIDLSTGSHTASVNFTVSNPEDYFGSLPINLPRDHPGIRMVTAGEPINFWRLSDLITMREFAQTGLYDEQFKPVGAKYQLATILPSSGHLLGISVDRDLDFTEQEEQTIRLLAPHLNRAHANARLYTSLLKSQRQTPHLTAGALLKYGITAREAETLQWLIEGKRNLEIAIILGISTRTVEKHVQSLLAKLGCETRTAAAARAQEILSGR